MSADPVKDLGDALHELAKRIETVSNYDLLVEAIILLADDQAGYVRGGAGHVVRQWRRVVEDARWGESVLT